jgi:Family of unknown function (DUF5662)
MTDQMIYNLPTNILFSLKQLGIFIKYKWLFFRAAYGVDVPFKYAITYKLNKLSYTNLKKFIKVIFVCNTESERNAALKALTYHYELEDPCHWRYWYKFSDKDCGITRAMPITFVRIMFADWGAMIALRDDPDKNIANWYFNHADSMLLDTGTRRTIETFLCSYVEPTVKTMSPVFPDFDAVLSIKTLGISDMIYIKATGKYYKNVTGKNESIRDWIAL